MASVTAQMSLRPHAPVLLKGAPGLSSTHLPCSPRTLPAKRCQPCPAQASRPPTAPLTPNPSCGNHGAPGGPTVQAGLAALRPCSLTRAQSYDAHTPHSCLSQHLGLRQSPPGTPSSPMPRSARHCPHSRPMSIPPLKPEGTLGHRIWSHRSPAPRLTSSHTTCMLTPCVPVILASSHCFL